MNAYSQLNILHPGAQLETVHQANNACFLQSRLEDGPSYKSPPNTQKGIGRKQKIYRNINAIIRNKTQKTIPRPRLFVLVANIEEVYQRTVQRTSIKPANPKNQSPLTRLPYRYVKSSRSCTLTDTNVAARIGRNPSTSTG